MTESHFPVYVIVMAVITAIYLVRYAYKNSKN